MRIYIDPTEAREGTRLPVRRGMTEAPGLEHVTGCDIMVTPLSENVPALKKIPPHRKLLKRHSGAGAVFIQRKSGGDFLSSIPDLKSIQDRMLEWARPGGCILLITGLDLECETGCDIGDYVRMLWGVLSGFAENTRGWTIGTEHSKKNVDSVIAALNAWRHRGGHVIWLPEDDMIVPWLGEIGAMVDHMSQNPVRMFSDVTPLQRLEKDPVNWVTTRSAFPPGIGRRLLKDLAKHVGGKGTDPVKSPPALIEVMRFMRDGDLTDVSGWGKGRQRETKRWWGMGADSGLLFGRSFSHIDIKFDPPLPFEPSGDGIEKIGDDHYRFTDVGSLEAVSEVLSATGGTDGP